MIEKIQKQAAPEVVAAVKAGTISINAARLRATSGARSCETFAGALRRTTTIECPAGLPARQQFITEPQLELRRARVTAHTGARAAGSHLAGACFDTDQVLNRVAVLSGFE